MKLKNLLMLLLTSSATLVCAQTAATPPDVLVKSVTNEVLQIILADKDIQAGDNNKTIALIELKVLPHFNFTHMTQLAVGKNWKIASAPEKEQLTNEFHTLLVRTYAKALTEYKNQSIVFVPLKMATTDVEVEVSTQITQRGSPAIKLNYSLEKMPAGWKIFDIEVDGVSLVTNYRSSFVTEVSNGGIAGLISTLQKKNATTGKSAKL